MPHFDSKDLRRFALIMLIAMAAIALTACAGKENVRQGSGGMTGAGMSGQTMGQNGGNAHRRDINVRGLEGIPKNERAKFLDPNNPLSTRTIYFAFDSSQIPSRFQTAIKAHAHYLATHAKTHLRLEGNTDERGTREYNLSLGERRAESVKQALVLYGANARQITTISYGEERPAVLGHTEAAYAKNRRVDLIYTKQ